MKFRSYIIPVVLAGVSMASAQVASHSPVASHAPAAKKPASNTPVDPKIVAMASKPVARVNSAELTEIDLKREMYAIFPYAQQHGGFPKDLEADIRKGALDMIIFEELLYQEAKRRNLTIPPERLARAQAAFRKQFSDDAAYEQYVRAEGKGDKAVMREKIRRSLLIERMLKTEVTQKSLVTPAVAKAYYDKNAVSYLHGETVAIQTISIVPPENPGREIQEEAKKKIKDIVRLGRAAKTARDFGLLAEQLSEDDWRTKMGNRGTVEVNKLPPEVVMVARKMKPGQVSDPIQLDRAWVVIRLNAHTPAGKTPFADVKSKLISDLQKEKTSEVRAELNKKLRKDAKIEVL